jgi:hypothetical protein
MSQIIPAKYELQEAQAVRSLCCGRSSMRIFLLYCPKAAGEALSCETLLAQSEAVHVSIHEGEGLEERIIDCICKRSVEG